MNFHFKSVLKKQQHTKSTIYWQKKFLLNIHEYAN